MKQTLSVLLLVLFLALHSSFHYLSNYAEICNDCEQLIAPRMDTILQGTSEPPFAYRVLTPMIQRAIGGEMWGLLIFHLVGSSALFLLAYVWVQRWGGNGLLAVLLLYVMLQISYATWYDSDYALTESVLLLVGWLLIMPKQVHDA